MSENATPDRQPLLRDRDQKMIAGVCTGLGRHLDIDPVVFRILFAVLTFFGGLGILAYAACWLIIPETGEDSSEAQRLLTGPNVYVAAGAAALMVLGLLWFTNILANRFDRSLPIILAGAAAIGVVVWRRENRGNTSGSTDRKDGPSGGPAGNPFTQAQTWWQRPVADHSPSTAGGPSIPEPYPAPTVGGPDTVTRAASEPADQRPKPDRSVPAASQSAVVADDRSAVLAGDDKPGIAPNTDGSDGIAAATSEPLEPADRIEPAATGVIAEHADSGAEEES